jgi:hypothetical protein
MESEKEYSGKGTESWKSHLQTNIYDVSDRASHIQSLPLPTPMPILFPEIAGNYDRNSDGNHTRLLDSYIIHDPSELDLSPWNSDSKILWHLMYNLKLIVLH